VQKAFVVPTAEYVKVGVTVVPLLILTVVPVKLHEYVLVPFPFWTVRVVVAVEVLLAE
jgi:hypothetical protein